MNDNVWSGLVLIAIAIGYGLSIGSIPQSSLSDEVGPAGLPWVLAIGLGLVGAILTIRGLWTLRSAQPADGGNEADKERAVAGYARALGVVACGALYIVVAWLAGYVVAVATLILVMALYEGIRPGWRPVAMAIGGAGAFWLLFVKALGVAQPAGILFGG